ncbi:MAG: hypothetical protein PQ612_05885 [Rickettsiales bacterium]|nr:hypothetical protein [Pseudomonadota bacterium]MDA0966853.1 hypothetical protein [Pseudomonadota bacterium]MDG4543528.1 hypothetical protein [Rickettsiales bacterium]MDG4545676.1 hypothetical protein [Rickettsiales bacterium]MDG4547551.1 hypothetical protein [Rickettsiales bacterium]
MGNKKEFERISKKTDQALRSLEMNIVNRIFESCVLSEQTQNELVRIMENRDASAIENRKAAISVILSTDNINSNHI